MAKYNTKAEGAKPTETNFMGEQAFKMGDKEELVATVMTTFLQNSYYEKESETVERIKDKISKVDPLFAAKLAIYARNEGKLRSVTHLIAATIAKDLSGKDWAKRFYNKIVVRPDDMSEILSAYATMGGMNLKNIRKIPKSMQKGFKSALERIDAYQIDKYKMEKRSVSLIDLVRLCHPKGTQKNAEAYKRLVKGESLSGLYDTKIFEKEMTKAGQESKGKTVEEKADAKAEAISSVLDNIKGMPMMNLLRNLRNIIIYAPNKTKEACEQLTTEKKVLNSRLLPFRFATAYSEIERMKYDDISEKVKGKTSISFESDRATETVDEEQFTDIQNMVLCAIEKALEISCQNIPELEGNVAILVDHSGSMRGDDGGSSKVSAFSKTRSSSIGNLFASMMAFRQKNVYIGLFGDRLISVPMDRSMGLLAFNEMSHRKGKECGGSTEAGIYDFFRDAISEKKKIDNVIVFSDCQIGDGSSRTFTQWYGTKGSDHSKGFHELFKEFKKTNPYMKFIVCNIRQEGGTSVFDRSQNVLNIAGWSENIFDTIKTNTKGFDAMIREIEAIEI